MRVIEISSPICLSSGVIILTQEDTSTHHHPWETGGLQQSDLPDRFSRTAMSHCLYGGSDARRFNTKVNGLSGYLYPRLLASTFSSALLSSTATPLEKLSICTTAGHQYRGFYTESDIFLSFTKTRLRLEALQDWHKEHGRQHTHFQCSSCNQSY